MTRHAVDLDLTEAPPRRALVIGASLAGLLAARVLSDHFQEVWLFERDTLPYGPVPRKGTPHAVQPHGLLARGREIIEQLLPGFTAALQAQGAPSADLGDSVAFRADGQRFAAQKVGHLGLGASRLAIEAEVRRQVLALPNVRLRDGVTVLAPQHGDGRVHGLTWQIAVLAGTSSDGEHLVYTPGDLVVDCSGRGSRSPTWLRDWGYEPPSEERVQVGIQYASAYFERDATDTSKPAASICTATPGLPRPAVLISQEPGDDGCPRWVVGVGGYQGDHPAATPEGLIERALAVGDPDIQAIVQRGRRLGPVLRYGFAFSQRRRYERLKRFPAGFLVMGDALASFNPIYGQGMTVAACEALALDQALRQSAAAPARPFFRAAARAIDVPWQLAVGADLALPGVPGPRPWPVRLVNAYVARLYRAAVVDSDVAAAFLKVVHLVAPPATLFAPGLAWRVWRHGAQAAAPGSARRPAAPDASASEAGIACEHNGLRTIGHLQAVENR